MSGHNTPAADRLSKALKDMAKQPPISKTVRPHLTGTTVAEQYVGKLCSDKQYKLYARLTDFTGQGIIACLSGDSPNSIEWTDLYTGLQLTTLLMVASCEPVKGAGYRLDVLEITEQEMFKQG